MLSLFRQQNRDEPVSLRKRYITLSLVLGIIVISVVLFYYAGIVSTRNKVSDELAYIHEELSLLDDIRDNLVEIYNNIDLFLLDPTHGNSAEITHQLITESHLKASKLSERLEKANVDSKLIAEVNSLGKRFLMLNESIYDLSASRMDINRQYPGMALSAFGMSEPQNEVTNYLQILITEIESGSLKPVSENLYPLLLKTHSLWLKHISQMRIYLANRLASFSTEILLLQAASLNDLHQQFMKNVVTIEKLYINEDSFEAEYAIQSIKKNAPEWYSLFQQVREISESDKWRTDSHLMKTVIIPQADSISDFILSIEKQLISQEETVAMQVRNSADTLSMLLFTVIVLFMFFIVAVIYSLDRMVFKPISSVTQALKSRAFNLNSPQLVSGKTREISYLIEAFKEMDEEVSQRQNDLQHQALHDHLTGLPNRFMLNQRIEYQLLTAERENKTFTIFFMDIDNFKDVNDSLGHAVGDILLIKAGERISNKIRKADTVARLGGDEYAILLPDTNASEAQKLAKTICESFSEPFNIDGRELNIGVSIGIVCYPDDGEDAQTLLQHADIAMYMAKRNRTGFASYDPNEDFYSKNRLSLVNDLHTAINEDELKLYYHPLINVDGENITGAEALLRWYHPRHGYIQPDKIIELAEYAGVINKLSLWVMDQAIKQCKFCHDLGHYLTVSVNLSVYDLANKSLCQQVKQLLDQHQLASNYLTLEITETGMMNNPARSIQVLDTLNKMGVKLAIDDFGTGFSSLSYLKQLPVVELKIDKSFVLDMERDDSDEVIVQSTINLGHNLGLTVVAEGIEHRGLFDMVKRYGCDKVQGYMFGKPCDAQLWSSLARLPWFKTGYSNYQYMPNPMPNASPPRSVSGILKR
ncbi:MAG: EAL domain-containing protein [Gammaproteobacteria bacterium]